MAENISDNIYFNNFTANSTNLEDQFNQPMPLIGVYIAVASLICTLAMVADTVHNFRRRRLWFPCRFFSLNAASLTVIAVAMKLPVDLNNPMYGRFDQQAKFTSAVFLCIMLANFMPSIGAMNDAELLPNMIALAILVTTISVNLCIEISTTMIVGDLSFIFAMVIFFQFLMLIIMSCSALTVSVSKNVLEQKYQQVHKTVVACNKESERSGRYNIERLNKDVNKYWIMAVTSSPQFVIACSEACSTCGAICIIIDIILMLSMLNTTSFSVINFNSVYGGSMIWILIIQSIGVVAGSVAPIFRIFTTLTFSLSIKWSKKYMRVFKVESYWTQRLELWKQISPFDGFRIGRTFRKFIHLVKNLVLDCCVRFVRVIVVLSKATRLLPNILVILFFYFYFCFKYLKRMCTNALRAPRNAGEEALASQSESASHFVLQLQDDVELSKRTLKNIVNTVNRFIQASRKREPRDLMDLLKKSKGFDGVVDFDDDQVPCLCSVEPPNCWSLPVITLTSIAVALPNIGKDHVDRLLNGVKEGLLYVKQIEKTLDAEEDLVTLRSTCDIMWPGVELCNTWLKNNLKNISLKSEESTLQWLSGKEKTIVIEERSSIVDQENPGEWSIRAIAANSMYRICETMMLGNQGSELETNEKLFEHLSRLIADILCACLTNLPQSISLKCYNSPVENREESVRNAACLLGETEEIIKVLSQRELPSLDLNQMACIDEWRRSMRI